jgi:hypothetical protein
MAAAVGHIDVVEKLVEAGCAWPHGKKANSGLGAPVDVVQLLAQKTGIPVSGNGGCSKGLLAHCHGGVSSSRNDMIVWWLWIQGGQMCWW